MGLKMPNKIIRNNKNIILSRYRNGKHEYDGIRYSESEEFESIHFSYTSLDNSVGGTSVLKNFMLKFAIDNKLRPGDVLEVSLKVVR